MPFVLRRFIPAQWMSCILHWSTLYGCLVIDRAGQKTFSDSHPTLEQQDEKAKGLISCTYENEVSVRDTQDSSSRFPLTAEQIDEQIEEFIGSIDQDAVCQLASRYNSQRPCNIIGQGHGSFNVCFFVRFNDNATWVVRIPLNPVVHDSWKKIQSEVATMRYLEHTTIPIPHVYAYGEGVKLTKTDCMSTAFMISDYIPGQSLRMNMLENATEERRRHFFHELIDILAELRRSEFSTAGSLMPNPDSESEPMMGGLLTMAANELQRYQGQQENVGVFTSVEAFMDYQYHVLSETCRLPSEELEREQAEEELFALDSLADQISKMDPRWSGGPFILTHLDLRCGNIIVTEDLHISGIIDWEFAGTVPLQYFTPPLWITGHARSGWVMPSTDPICKGFYKVLEAKSTTSMNYTQLMEEWNPQTLMFPIVQILRQPDTLLYVYYRFIFRKLFEGNREQVISDFFNHDDKKERLALEIQRRVEKSKRYTQYLDDRGLLVVDEDAAIS